MRQENAWRVVSLRRAGESGTSVKSLVTFVSLLSQFAAAAPGNYKLLSVIFAEYGRNVGEVRRDNVRKFTQSRTNRSIPRRIALNAFRRNASEAKDPLYFSRFNNDDLFNLD